MGRVHELRLPPISNLPLKCVTFFLYVSMLFARFELFFLGNFVAKLIPVINYK